MRYQIRLGNKDLEVLIKNHKDFDYKPYRKINLKALDPNGDVPDWDVTNKNSPDMNHAVNPFDSGKQEGKRGAVESPIGHKS